MIVLNGEEGLECEIIVNEMRLEDVSKFKYLGCVLNESRADKAEYHKKVASVRKAAGAIGSIV